jgi:hypothetical protein
VYRDSFNFEFLFNVVKDANWALGVMLDVLDDLDDASTE